MADNSHISWTDSTWNPTIGCSKISPGCAGCYAVQDVNRMGGNPNPKMRAANGGLVRRLPNGKLDWTGEVREQPDRLDTPIRKKKATMYFVNSLSDLFHENVSFDYDDAIFAAMILSKAIGRDHIFQALTKRAERMRTYMDSRSEDRDLIYNAAFRHFGEEAANAVANSMNGQLGEGRNANWPPSNVWLGVSVEDVPRKTRIDSLRATVAATRFLSLEPLLADLGVVNLDGIHWVIVGGESKAGARPMHPDWARSLRDQCVAAGVAFHFKQWGEWGWGDIVFDDEFSGGFAFNSPRGGRSRVPIGTGERTHNYYRPTDDLIAERVGKKAAGRLLDGRTWDEFPKGTR